jgi:lactate dehydrogenase-like 2-hydroxyacid dehydrogenase
VIITPHVAFYSEFAVDQIVKVSLDSNLALIKGEKLSNIIDHQ